MGKSRSTLAVDMPNTPLLHSTQSWELVVKTVKYEPTNSKVMILASVLPSSASKYKTSQTTVILECLSHHVCLRLFFSLPFFQKVIKIINELLSLENLIFLHFYQTLYLNEINTHVCFFSSIIIFSSAKMFNLLFFQSITFLSSYTFINFYTLTTKK